MTRSANPVPPSKLGRSALKLNPSPQQRIRLRLHARAKNCWRRTARPRRWTIIKQLLAEAPDYPGRSPDRGQTEGSRSKAVATDATVVNPRIDPCQFSTTPTPIWITTSTRRILPRSSPAPRRAGITKIISIATDFESSRRAAGLGGKARDDLCRRRLASRQCPRGPGRYPRRAARTGAPSQGRGHRRMRAGLLPAAQFPRRQRRTTTPTTSASRRKFSSSNSKSPRNGPELHHPPAQLF